MVSSVNWCDTVWNAGRNGMSSRWPISRPRPPHFSKDALRHLTIEGAVDRKAQTGGTARKQVTRQMNAWETRLAKKPKN